MSKRTEAVCSRSLEYVLAVGLSIESIDAKAKTLQRKLENAELKKGKGITKPKSGLTPTLENLVKNVVDSKTTVTLQDELRVMTDVFEFIDNFLPCTYSPESEALIMCVGACRYFEHNSLMDTDFAMSFYDAAYLFLGYLEGGDDLLRGAPIGTIFDDKQRGQARREIYNDVTARELFYAYFSDLTNFIQYVRAGEWEAAKEGIILLVPSLVNAAFHLVGMLPAEWGPANDVLGNLNRQFKVQQRSDPAFFIAGMARRQTWVENAEWWQQLYRRGGAAASDLKDAIAAAVFQRKFSGVADIAMATPIPVEGVLETLLRVLWRYDMMAGPLGRIAMNLSFVLLRASHQVALFQTDSVKQYIQLNEVRNTRMWKYELDKAADMQVGLAADEKRKRKKTTDQALKEFIKSHKSLSEQFYKKYDEQPNVSLLGRMVNRGVSVAKTYVDAMAFKRWRSGIKKKIASVDKQIAVLKAIQLNYTDQEMKDAKEAVENELVNGIADEDGSSDDDDERDIEEGGGDEGGGGDALDVD